MTKLDPQVERELRRGVIDIIPERDFFEALASGRKLRFKFGLDPSKPDLHIGHGVLLRKLRLLQEMGHQVVLIVGDWTAQIGDPSGQSVMRPMLTAEEVRANAETYMRQFFHIVDKAKTEVRWQSEWFDKFTLADSIRLAARFTVAQMLQREDFRTRYEAQKPLGVHELFYPLLQAYDSVVIGSDVEFGGTDQLFNLLVGRELQQEVGQRPQICITMRLLVGTDGAQKMSKSLGNTVDFEDPPSEKYGKVMSLPDSALPDYLDLATDVSEEELAYILKQLEERSINPMDIKKRVAREIVAQFHGVESASEAEAEWVGVFSQRQAPTSAAVVMNMSLHDMSTNALSRSGFLASGPDAVDIEIRYPGGEDEKITIRQGPYSKEALAPFMMNQEDAASPPDGIVDIALLAMKARIVTTKRQFRDLLSSGAVEVDGEKQIRPLARVRGGSIVRVGKHRFLRITDTQSSAGPRDFKS